MHIIYKSKKCSFDFRPEKDWVRRFNIQTSKKEKKSRTIIKMIKFFLSALINILIIIFLRVIIYYT